LNLGANFLSLNQLSQNSFRLNIRYRCDLPVRSPWDEHLSFGLDFRDFISVKDLLDTLKDKMLLTNAIHDE